MLFLPDFFLPQGQPMSFVYISFLFLSSVMLLLFLLLRETRCGTCVALASCPHLFVCKEEGVLVFFFVQGHVKKSEQACCLAFACCHPTRWFCLFLCFFN